MKNKSSDKTTEFSNSSGVLELLLTLALLTACAYPAVYMFRASGPKTAHSQAKYTAVLLAHHIMESIIAQKLVNPSYVPDITAVKSVVGSSDSDLFFNLSNIGLSGQGDVKKRLIASLNGFEYNIDTYYLEENVYKIIVYVVYKLDDRPMSLYFERLLPQGSELDETKLEAEHE